MEGTESLTITQLQSDVLAAKIETRITIGQLEATLLASFPAADSEEWDRFGLLVGDPNALVTGVAIALDPNVEAIQIAADLGTNVLLTHHPVFLNPPETIKASEADFAHNGQAVWEAITRNVALMNFHTSLDVSTMASRVLPSMLGLSFQGLVSPLEHDSSKGYGQLCIPFAHEANLNLGQLAARCTTVFARLPRVWGNANRTLNTVVTCTGSASNLLDLCIQNGYDCLICGEIRYHQALIAKQQGLCIIELGHDTSELPLCAVLAQSTQNAGIPEEMIRVIDQGYNWWTPETTRR